MTNGTSAGTVQAPETFFRQSLREGVFRLPFCSVTDKAVFYPRVLSPYSGTPLTEWREVSGDGTVYSTTTVRRKPEQGGDYNISLIDLDEGARMMSRVEDIPPGEVRIGLRVSARISDAGGEPLIIFTPRA